MPTNSFSCCPMARTPASPTTPIAMPAARPLCSRPAVRHLGTREGRVKVAAEAFCTTRKGVVFYTHWLVVSVPQKQSSRCLRSSTRICPCSSNRKQYHMQPTSVVTGERIRTERTAASKLESNWSKQETQINVHAQQQGGPKTRQTPEVPIGIPIKPHRWVGRGQHARRPAKSACP